MIMDFIEFDKLVKTYYPLNKDKTRYLVLFLDGHSEVYKFDWNNKTAKIQTSRVLRGAEAQEWFKNN